MLKIFYLWKVVTVKVCGIIMTPIYYIWTVILRLFVIRRMKRKKLYLSFFYGSKQELTRAFNKITNGDYVRYIMTAETLICRFRSNKPIDEIMEILREHCPDLPFFVFPITASNYRYNLPLNVENNLLTDNPIIPIPSNQAVNQYFMAIIDELKKHYPEMAEEPRPDFTNSAIDRLNVRLNQAIAEENFELAAQIRDKIKELQNNNNQQTD